MEISSQGCQIKDCKSRELIRSAVDGVWLVLCREHQNRLQAFLGYTQEHEDYLVAFAEYRRTMSGYPQSSGMSDDRDSVSGYIGIENRMRSIIENWLLDPDEAERIIDDR